MASLTSECDFNTFAGKEIQHTIFFSLTTYTNPYHPNPRVPAVQNGKGGVYGVRVHFFLAFGYLSIPFRLQSVDELKEGDQWQMWEFIRV